MTSRPWLAWYPADYLNATVDLSAEEHGVYLVMLMLAWRREDAALPNDMTWLKRALGSCINGMHGRRFNRLVPPLLARFFVLDPDGKFRNKRLTREREKLDKTSEIAREKSWKRWSKTNRNNALPDAGAMLLHTSQREERRASEVIAENAQEKRRREVMLEANARLLAREGEPGNADMPVSASLHKLIKGEPR